MIKCLTEIPPNHNINKIKVAKLENQYKEKLEAMMRILQNLSSNLNSQEASVPGWSNIINNIDKTLMHRSPPKSRQNFPVTKNSRFDQSDTDISDLFIERFGGDESCQKLYSK